MDIETNIEGYTVSVTHTDETVCCDIQKGRFSASLALAEDDGVLYDYDYLTTLRISQSALKQITSFALKHGY